MQREPANNEPAAERREARIAKLREQYQAGTYHIEADKVSAKIIEAHIVAAGHLNGTARVSKRPQEH